MTDWTDFDELSAEQGLPPTGSTLIVGPSGVGKTRLTARILSAWLENKGVEGVVVLEFGPSIETDDRVVGGRLDRFVDIPGGIAYRELDARAPRLEGTSSAETVELARTNAERAVQIFDTLPADPTAVFVNDATIPFQHESGDIKQFTAYCDRATCAVVNAYEGEELGIEDAVSTRERAVIATLRQWADSVVNLK